MPARRMLPFILINVVVSAVVVLAILYFWDNRRPADRGAVQANTAVTQTAAPLAPALPNLPQSTDTPEPQVEGPPVHVVKSGDTLATISQIYDVPMADIVEANGLANPNVLSVGQQLVIPVGGLPTATPIPTLEPTVSVLPSPIPTEPITQSGEAVVEITAVISPGELETEAVQIINSGSSPIALLDWKLVDAQGHIYTFAQVTLFGDGAGLLVHTNAGRDGATDVYWGNTEAVWEPGELVSLLNGSDEIQATFTVP